MLTKDQLQYLDDTRVMAYMEGALWTLSRFASEYPEGELAAKLEALYERVKKHMDERGDAPVHDGRDSN